MSMQRRWDDICRWFWFRTFWWTIKRPWCWLVRHEVHAIVPSGRFDGENTHFCPRCLKFWRSV